MESADRYWLDELTAVPETAAILDELGVADSPAMNELDAEDCARLTAQMKKVPQAATLQLLLLPDNAHRHARVPNTQVDTRPDECVGMGELCRIFIV